MNEHLTVRKSNAAFLLPPCKWKPALPTSRKRNWMRWPTKPLTRLPPTNLLAMNKPMKAALAKPRASAVMADAAAAAVAAVVDARTMVILPTTTEVVKPELAKVKSKLKGLSRRLKCKPLKARLHLVQKVQPKNAIVKTVAKSADGVAASLAAAGTANTGATGQSAAIGQPGPSALTGRNTLNAVQLNLPQPHSLW